MDKKTFNIHNLDLYSLSKDFAVRTVVIIMIGSHRNHGNIFLYQGFL